MGYGTPTRRKTLPGQFRVCPDCQTNTDDWSVSASYCRPCNTERARAWALANPDRARRNSRDAQYKRKYGISLDEYETLAALQDFKCRLCEQENPERLLVVDHCHSTGAVRGLLCDKCNVSIGRLGDTIESIEKVLAYMKGEL